jgi:biofilm protein TabA
MILAPLAHASRYFALHPLLPAAFAFLERTDLAALPEGKLVLEGEDLFATVARLSNRPRADSPLEFHRRYLDIHFLLSGEEEIGWRPTSDCHARRGSFDAGADIQFADDTPECWALLRPGNFLIVWPEDAHAPLAGSGELHKVVVKIAVHPGS